MPFDESVQVSPRKSDALATRLATSLVANECLEPVIRTYVGRPGLDPGTLGLKVAFESSIHCQGIHMTYSEGYLCLGNVL